MNIKTMSFAGKAVLLGLALAMFIIGVLLATMIFRSSAVADTGDDAASNYQVNEAGQTYGSVLDIPKDGERPDLLAAEATNGESGYVYYSDLDDPDSAPANPEEATQMMEERGLSDGQIFVAAFGEKLGVTIEVDDETARDAYAAALDYASASAPGVDDAWEGSGEEIAAILGMEAAVFPAEAEFQTVLVDSFIAVQDAHAVEIPVYTSDGTTVIGTFLASE
jgi:hypothetical protein